METTAKDDDNANASNLGEVKHGQGLRAVVEARRRELEGMLAEINAAHEPSPRVDGIKFALESLANILTGDLDHISDAVAGQINKWLETSKNLS